MIGDGLPGFDDLEPMKVVVPGWTTLLEGVEVQPWLLERAGELGDSPSTLDKLAAIGLVGRMTAIAVVDPKTLLGHILSGRPSPRELAEALIQRQMWTRELDCLEAAAIERAGALLFAVASMDLSSANVSLATCLERDEMESILLALEAAGAGGTLRLVLQDVDWLEPNVRRADDPQLSAVSCITPEAWWGSEPPFKAA